jgi:transcriptional regulator with XRE-family HTH domain
MSGDELKAIRLRLGLTQRQLAQVLGYGHAMRISDFERGTNRVPIPHHIALLMDAIDKGYRPEGWPQQEQEA